MPMRMFRSIRNRLATRLTPLLHWMERWANKRWFDYPFGSQPHASKEEYLRLFKEVSKKEYEEMFKKMIMKGMGQKQFRKQPVSIALHSIIMLLNPPVYWYQPRKKETEKDRKKIEEQISYMAVSAL